MLNWGVLELKCLKKGKKENKLQRLKNINDHNEVVSAVVRKLQKMNRGGALHLQRLQRQGLRLAERLDMAAPGSSHLVTSKSESDWIVSTGIQCDRT